MSEEEYPKEIVFIVNSEDEEMHLWYLLNTHNVKSKPKLQEPDTYILNLSDVVIDR